MARSKLGDRKARHDRFHNRARKKGFNSRAVFKLEEIDSKHKLVGRNHRVLDLGCAPGSCDVKAAGWTLADRGWTGPESGQTGIGLRRNDLGL